MGTAKLLALLKLIGDWINRFLVRREQKEAQQSHDQLEENPGDWFDEHFGSDADRMRTGAAGAKSATDQTDPDNDPR